MKPQPAKADPGSARTAWTPPFSQNFTGMDFFPFLGAARYPTAPETLSGLGPAGHWAVPIYDADELEKRIRDLRTVHFWLEQNTRALGMTIQTLEVQKMTLLTLKSMNLGLQEMAQAFTLKPQAQDGAAPAQPATGLEPTASPDPAPAASVAADALQWWSALSAQFQNIATDTLRDLAAQAALKPTADARPEASAAAPAAAPTPVDATPHANVAPQTAPPKPRKRPPPATRATRASS